MNPTEPRQLIHALPEVDPPTGLAAAVNARLVEVKHSDREEAPVSASGWLLLSAGALVSMMVLAMVLLSGRVGLEINAPVLQQLSEQLINTAFVDPTLYVLAIGVLLYAGGIFWLSRD